MSDVEWGEGVRTGGGIDSVNDVCEELAETTVSGRERVDVEGSGERAVGRSRETVTFSDLFGLTRPVTPLATTCGWTPRKGTSRPIIPMMLC